MRKTLFFSAFLITINYLSAQIPIGIKHDVNGMPLNGYFDPIIYAPEKKILKIHHSDSYENGYYYDSLGNKIEGLIKFENDKIFFKKKEQDFRIKIKPHEIRHFVIGVDSFFVADKFYYKNKLKDKPEFVQYITEFDGYTFAKHYHFTSGLAQQYAMVPAIIETFLVKHADSLIWDNFPDNNKFKSRALQYFSHIPSLKDKITRGEYTSEDMLSVIKLAEYLDKYNNVKLVYYDKYWQEVQDRDNAVYSAKIADKTDSIWTFEYYRFDIKLYEGHYSSFFPHIKNGDFIAFYPDDKTRQIITYSDNKPTEVKTYYANGLLKTQYKIIENIDEYGSITDVDIKYLVVNDTTGHNILEAGKIAELSSNDKLNGIAYSHKYAAGDLVSVYRIFGGDTVFQISDPDYNFKLKRLQRKFNSFMIDKNYEDALNENAQGIILVSLLINNKGIVVEGQLLNSVHPELDRIVNNFIASRVIPSAGYRHKFKPYKKNKEKRYCEVVVPFEFGVNRYYRKPANYYHFYHWNFHHMMNPPMINNFKPPTVPMRF